LELEANLRSSFIQNYPKFEIIFSVASLKDPAIEIVNQLIKEFHHVDSRLIIGKFNCKSVFHHHHHYTTAYV
jgi:ceramide glucosyltransferase